MRGCVVGPPKPLELAFGRSTCIRLSQQMMLVHPIIHPLA
jgi:hypothetical protein